MAGRMKIVDVVTKFKGERGEDIEQWLDRLAVAVELTSLKTSQAERTEEMVKMLPLFLEDSAYATWKQLSEEERSDFEIVKRELRRVYGKSKSAAWQELKALQLLPGDSVDVLADEAKKLLGVVIGGDTPHEELVSVAVIDALPPHVADQVRMQHGETMDLSKVVSCAKSLLTDQNDTSRNHFTVAYAASKPGQTDQPIKKAGSFDTTSKPTGRRCYGCHRIGHLRRNCSTTCFQCGRKGHLKSECRAASRGNGSVWEGSAGSCYPRGGALTQEVMIDGRRRRAMIDTGCSVTLISQAAAGNRRRERNAVSLETMNRVALKTRGAVWLSSIKTDKGIELGAVKAHVLPTLPLGVDAILGLDMVLRHGLSVTEEEDGPLVSFGKSNREVAGVASGRSAKTVTADRNSSSSRNSKLPQVRVRQFTGHRQKESTCAYRPKGNVTTGQVNRAVKRTEKWAKEPAGEAVLWENSTCGEQVASPYELVFSAKSRKPGVTRHCVEVERPLLPTRQDHTRYFDCERNPFVVGDAVYLRPPKGRCDSKWSGPHRITAIRSSVSVVLNDDGVSRHVSHLRRVPGSSVPRVDAPRPKVLRADSSDDSSDGEGESNSKAAGAHHSGVDRRADDESQETIACNERRAQSWRSQRQDDGQSDTRLTERGRSESTGEQDGDETRDDWRTVQSRRSQRDTRRPVWCQDYKMD